MTGPAALGKRYYAVEMFMYIPNGPFPTASKRVGHDFPSLEEARSWCARKLAADRRARWFEITEWISATRASVATNRWSVDRATFGLPER